MPKLTGDKSHYLTVCSHADVVYHPWKKEHDGDQTREIMYTIALTNPLAPKTATVTETQVGWSPPPLVAVSGSVAMSGYYKPRAMPRTNI